MRVKRRNNETVNKMHQAINCDGIHPDNNQRKCPATSPRYVDNVVKKGEQPETPASTEQHPGRCPDTFDDGTNPKNIKKNPTANPDSPCNEEPGQHSPRCFSGT